MTDLNAQARDLLALRKARGLTQLDLAKTMGVVGSAVCFWEQGTQYPSLDKLPALAQALGVDYNELVPALILSRGRAGR